MASFPKNSPLLRIRRLLALALIIAGLGLAALTVWRGRSTDGVDRGRRSLLLVTVDTTRADRLMPYGGDVPTPTFAKLAAEGVVYEHAFSVAPITLVAHTSMLTGLWPPQHGVRNNGIHAAQPGLETLAERLGGQGWQTAAFVSAAVLDSRYGLDQGFEAYDDDLSTGRQRLPRMVPDRPAGATIDSARAWLDANSEEGRFFLWVHLYDPHAPYSPPSPHREALPGRPYDGEIAYLDAELGRLLEHPSLDSEQAVTLVIGDHGESLGEHRELTHALLAYDSTLHVPFFLRWPGGPAGARVSSPVSHVDLVPTVLDLLDLPPDRDLPGRSVVPGSDASRRPVESSPRLLYSETYLPHFTYGWAKVRVARRGALKYFETPTPELYDLRLDPRELSNLAEQQPGAAHDLARDLREWLADFDDAERESLHQLDAESEAELRSLGYLAVGSLPPRQGLPLDPKDVIDLHTGLERARQLQSDALFDLAAAELRQVLVRDPDNLAALVDLADNLARQGDLAGAAASIERALALDPSSSRLHLQLAVVESRRHRLEQSLALVERALQLDPRQMEASIHRARVLRRLGRGQEGRLVLEQALESYPDEPRLLAAHAGMVLMPEKRLEAAELALRRSLELDPFLSVARRRLGEGLETRGLFEAAIKEYREGVARQPRDAELQAHLGLLLARRGAEDAEQPLREAIRLASGPRSDLFLALAGWLDQRGQRPQAEAVYEQLESRPARSPRDINNRALALLGLGRKGESRRLLETLVEAHPHLDDALNNLAAVTVELEDWAAAEGYTRRLLDRRPRLPEAWNNLGAALEGQGRQPEALESFRRALEIDPGYWRAELNIAMSLAASGDSGAAEKSLRSLLEREPDIAEAHWQMALLLRAKSSPEARQYFTQFLSLADSEDPRAAEARASGGTGDAGNK